ncbi:hypothetical protein IP88_08705 [alpha proteobacterium AAP81b]|nr:hypothetical protein IP88_08705 [alpha proteobacterium AAP81b]
MAVVRHRIEYSAADVPLEQVIEALQAQALLLSEGVAAMSAAAPGSEYRIVSITVSEIKAGSLLIDLLIELYGIYQKDVDAKVIGGLESLTGVDAPPEYEALVTLFMLGVTFYVALAAYSFVRKKKKELPDRPLHIEGDYNTVIMIIADKLTLTRDAVDALLAERLPQSRMRSLVKPVSDFFRPAKRQPGSVIKAPGVTVGPESIGQFPIDADLEGVGDTEIVNMPDTLIEIRATDRDRAKQGWAARVIDNPDMPDKRYPMGLYPTVDAEALAALETVRADLAVEMVKDADGSFRPKRLHLLAYREVPNDNA